MLSTSAIRLLRASPQSIRLSRRGFSTTFRSQAADPETSDAKRVVSTETRANVPAIPEDGETKPLTQAPNRVDIWSRSQNPRSRAMTGPRFEQTNFELQPQPYAAIELIHKQPVKWTHDRIVTCDGGGGPTGHPKIFINTDKPEIAACSYCGLPYANEHHRKSLESLPATSYPLA